MHREIRHVVIDDNPLIEDLDYVRLTYTVPASVVGFADDFDELSARKADGNERREIGLMLHLVKKHGGKVRRSVLDKLCWGMAKWGELEDEDAAILRDALEDGICEYHVHGPLTRNAAQRPNTEQPEDGGIVPIQEAKLAR